MLYLLLLLLTFLPCCPEITIVPLSEINVTELGHVKKKVILVDKAEINLYCTKNRSHFIKIWGPTYQQGTVFFYDAIKKGFFNELSPTIFQSIIVDNNNLCRGYITKAGTLIHESETVKRRPIELRGRTMVPFANLEEQNDQAFRMFYEKLKKTTEKTRYVFTDFTPYNVVYCDGQYQLIDLDEIRPLNQVTPVFFNDLCSPDDYRQFVRNLSK